MKTVLVKINCSQPDKRIIKEAARLLRNGGLVAFPTETVYGLGVNLLDHKAITTLYRIKRRPKNKPFTIHIADIETVRRMIGEIPPKARRLMRRFWPGPLTIILKNKAQAKVGFRMPDNKIAFLLIKEAGVPVVAPSANISGKKPPVNAEEVVKDLDGKIDMVLDGGRTKVGVESTVVDMTGCVPKILREGAISEDTIKNEIGC